MKNPSGKKIDKLVFGMFDQMVEGADKYVTKQGSTWLIFTESRKWVIEFTKDKTLWFNYNVFQNELDLIGKDCTEERDLIKDWFESRFLNKPKVWATFNHAIDSNQAVEDTIQNGVKEAHHVDVMKFFDKKMENTIKNGVKDTIDEKSTLRYIVEDTIQEGVKHTEDMVHISKETVEDTIQNGVKHTLDRTSHFPFAIEDTIQNGVKETTPSGYLGSIEMKGKIVHQIESPKQNNEVEDTIQNGVKHTIDIEFRNKFIIEDTIQNGVKDIIDPFWVDPIRIKDAIENGVKQTSHSEDEDLDDVEDTIQNGVKDETIQGWDFKIKCEETIENGVKHTYYGYDREESYIEDTIENGVKETKEDRLFRTIHVMNAIVNGVKHAQPMDEWVNSENIVSNVINDGVKYVGNSRIVGETLLKGVIENGVKETKESMLESWEQIDHQVTNSEITENINDAIENGVKEMQPLPAQDGNRDWGLYYRRKGHMTKPHTEYVKEVIEDPYNHRGRVEGIIRNTDKDGI